MTVVAVKGKARSAKAKVEPSDGRELLSALSGRIEPVRVGAGYRLGLLLVAVAMLVLPLIYVALVTGVGCLVYWHAVHNVSVLDGRGGGRGRLLLYVAPLVIGAVLLLFMIKPLFARRPKRSDPVTLSVCDEPVLFAFVQRLCAIVGAPRPARIDVDCQVNASASFGGGWLSLPRRDLVLTIGLPLVAGLTLRQLTGVLAHEFGHFAQGTGMRLTYVIRSMNAWFYRVVYERDAWDEWLVNAQREMGGGAIALVVLVSRFFVWLTRRVLWCLMAAGHGISSFMLRQMEFDADRYEARVAGADAFAQTVDRLRLLNVGSQAAFNDLEAAWRERRLCDDLPQLIRAREADLPEELRKLVCHGARPDKTGWFDTHPCDSERLASVRRENAPGIFRGAEAPASVLFKDFAALSRWATVAFYRSAIDRKLKPENLIPTESLVESRGKKKESYASLTRYFQGLIDPVRPAFFDSATTPPRDADTAAELIFAGRTALTDAAPTAVLAARRFAEADQALAAVARIRALWRAGVSRVDAKSFGLPGNGTGAEADVQAVERHATAMVEAARAALDSALAPAMARLRAALDLEKLTAAEANKGSTPGSTGSEDDADDFGEYDLADEPEAGSGDRLVDALRLLRATSGGIERLRQQYYAFGALLSQVSPGQNSEELVAEVISLSRKTSEQMMETHGLLRGTLYPYEHAERGASVARYALEHVPPPEEVVAVYHAAEAMIEAVYSLYMRVLADLANRAEQAESSLGLPPLAEPSAEGE